MSQLLALFKPTNHFQRIITPLHIANHSQLPPEIAQEIRTHPAEFVKYIQLQSGQGLQEIEKLTLLHLQLMHAPELNELLESLHLNLRASDTWINDHLLIPYQNFLRKLMLSSQQYQIVRVINAGWNSVVASQDSFQCKTKMRQCPKQYFNFQVLCYCINMLNDIFGFLKKVPTLGRYYPKRTNSCYTSFVYTASYQAVLLYFAFRFIASELLLHHQDYLPTSSEEHFFKDILGQHLESINQQLKNLLLNKYYNPIERGIKVSLFEVDRQPAQNRQALYQLNILKRENEEKRKKNRQFLGQKIFGNGSFDSNIFQESLLWISSKDYRQKDLQEVYDKQNIQANRISNKQTNK